MTNQLKKSVGLISIVIQKMPTWCCGTMTRQLKESVGLISIFIQKMPTWHYVALCGTMWYHVYIM